jgi:hypothetical protein
MANWAANRLRFSGSTEEVRSFLEFGFAPDPSFNSREVLNFRAWLPMPDALEGLDRHDAALGVTILTRRPVRQFGKEFDLFENRHVQASGQRSYEALEAWARENKPEWLEAGRASLAANQLTGYACAEDWMDAVWGTAPFFEEFRFDVRLPDQVELAFSTKFTAPEGVIREIARRFPKASVWAAACEHGWNYGYRLQSEGGRLVETNSAIDEALLRDVQGAAYPEPRFTLVELGFREISCEKFWSVANPGGGVPAGFSGVAPELPHDEAGRRRLWIQSVGPNGPDGPEA